MVNAYPVLHYPRLDTVLMIEDAIKNADGYKTKTQIWRSLPKKVMYQTFQLTLSYLEKSNKVVIDKDGKVVWVFADNQKLKKTLLESVKVR
ncbi:MAG: hypothetical protein V1875_04975 [Candidatus Altiarchaeota archaeon]